MDNRYTIGTVVSGTLIGKRYRHLFIWLKCDSCGIERWVDLPSVKNQKHLGQCSKCRYRTGLHSFNWKGGRIKRDDYIAIYVDKDDFFSSMIPGLRPSGGYVSEHRLVMAKHLGRCLHRWEIVHHKHTKYPAGSIEDKQDNRIENLQLVSDDRHKQITVLENRIRLLEKRVTMLEAENILLKQQEIALS